eukprot:TRINITY_DN8124_c0_g1_i1.p3 TRINITY_DN8124_c0_g1~~TRINITY_DN8124_c0_g1_i1.p3  ORF type:complete len:125 (+),score=41.53 TRINITY_DN8124_c0_g1_i1:60-434(+)
MQALDATLAPHQLDLFDDRQFQSLLFSLISCPGLMQELRQREDLQVKALLPGLSSMDALTELYHSEEEAQHTLATCLRALQAMFGTAAGRGARGPADREGHRRRHRQDGRGPPRELQERRGRGL